jgi:FtsX-like permease family protein
VKQGVAVAILTAVDKKSVVLFTLVLVVCVLFVANSATAAVRGRRRELGVLACLGWTRPRLFAVVLGELAAIGLAAGVLGAVAALRCRPCSACTPHRGGRRWPCGRGGGGGRIGRRARVARVPRRPADLGSPPGAGGPEPMWCS